MFVNSSPNMYSSQNSLQDLFSEENLENQFNALKKDGELLPTVTEVSINREGVLSWRASNGKFYCRQPVVSCDCCDNICGPNQGCNCTACQELEKTEREKGNVNQMCLPFLHPPCCWSWGSNLEKTDLHDYLQTLQVYQQVTLFKTTESVKSLERLNKRMTVLGRYLASLSRECFDKENKDNKEVKTKTHSHSEESKKKKEVNEKEQSPYLELARAGVRTMLSFAFSILQRAWRKGEDTDICSALLTESLETLQKLPEGLLFNKAESSPIWEDVLDKASKFLENVVLGLEGAVVPLLDRQKALSLLFEIAFQHGTLNRILHVVLILLKLSTSGSENELTVASLGNIVQRLQKLGKEVSPSAFMNTEGTLLCGIRNVDSDEPEFNVCDVALAVLAQLNDMTKLYAFPAHSVEEKDMESGQTKQEVFHWGGSCYPAFPKEPSSCKPLMDLPVKQICYSQKDAYILTRNQRLFMFEMNADTLKIVLSPNLPPRIQILQIVSNVEGSHFLAISSEGAVYSWGSNQHGCLGHGDASSSDVPRIIHGLYGKSITHISCGSQYSAAVTSEGELYTWGSGINGRLGHDEFCQFRPSPEVAQNNLFGSEAIKRSNEDSAVPKLVEGLQGHSVIDVSCGSGNAQTLAVTSDGTVWSWGDGEYGKLGRGAEEGCKIPKEIQTLKSITHIKRVMCGYQFSVALTKDGRVITWGRGDSYQLGHGIGLHVRYPKVVEALHDKFIIDVAVGRQHCLAVTKEMGVYFWGTHDFEKEEDSCIREPTHVHQLHGTRDVGIAAGPAQSFCWSTGISKTLASKVPFSIDICKEMFEKLNTLLSLCDSSESTLGGTSSWFSESSDQVCLYTLNLLKLQMLATVSCGLDKEETGLIPGDPLLESLKGKVVNFACRSDVSVTVQMAAQDVLRQGWSVILPTSEERMETLLDLLGDTGADTIANSGKDFMVDLLSKSLLGPNGLNVALDKVIDDLCQSRSKKLDSNVKEKSAADILVRFIEQLLKSICLEALGKLQNENKDNPCYPLIEEQCDELVKLAYRFQRLLVARLFRVTQSDRFWPARKHQSSGEVKAIASILNKYVFHLVHNCKQLLWFGYETVLDGMSNFPSVARQTLSNIPGHLFGEFLVMMTITQNYAPVVTSTSEGLPILGELLDYYDKFNKLMLDWEENDKQDLSWPDESKRNFIPSKEDTTANQTSTPLMTTEDIEKQTNSGKILVVIHGNVYDLTDFKNEAPCGTMLIEHYSGRNASSVYDSVHHSEEAKRMMDAFLVGKLKQPCNDQTDGRPWLAFLDIERNLALVLGLYSGHLARGVAATTDEILQKKWLKSELFSSGVISSAILKETNRFDDGILTPLECLVHNRLDNEYVQEFISTVKQFSEEKGMELPIKFPVDHPIEKASRAMLAACIKHLSQEDTDGVFGKKNNGDSRVDIITKQLAEIIFSVFKQKMKLIRYHQERDKSYDEICGPIAEKCMFIFYCLSPAYQNRDRLSQLKRGDEDVSRWKDMAVRVSEILGDRWHVDSWNAAGKKKASATTETEHQNQQFHSVVIRQFLDFVCDDSINLDIFRKCFLYQIKRVKQRLMAGYLTQSYIIRETLMPSVRYSFLCGWMGLLQPGGMNRPKPAIRDNIGLVATEELVKLKSVFWSVARCTVGILQETIRNLCFVNKTDKGKSVQREAAVNSARFLTAAVGMLTSEIHSDNIDLLIRSGVLAAVQSVVNYIDGIWEGEVEKDSACSVAVIVDETRHQATSIRNLSGPEMAKLMKLGTRVEAGADWKWGDQAGPSPSRGRVISEVGEDGWVRVQWDTGSTNSYRMGKEGKFDLKLADPYLAIETSEDEKGEDDKIKENVEFEDKDRVLRLVYQCCINFLQHMSVLISLHTDSVSDESIRILSGLLLKVTSQQGRQHRDWATLGFIKGLCASDRIRGAVSHPLWTDALLHIVRSSVATSTEFARVLPMPIHTQVLALKLLEVVLPCVSEATGCHQNQTTGVVRQLTDVLGKVLVNSFPFYSKSDKERRSSKSKILQPSVTASPRSTIAEGLVTLLRSLQSNPSWNQAISRFLQDAIERIPHFLSSKGEMSSDSETFSSLQESSNEDVSVLAALAVLGGADNRVRLGGTVEHEEHGRGTVTRITRSGKISVQCETGIVVRKSPLLQWKVTKSESLDVGKMLLKESSEETTLFSLLHLASVARIGWSCQKTSDNELPKGCDASALSFDSKGDSIDFNLLQRSQIALGLLKASKTLLSSGTSPRKLSNQCLQGTGSSFAFVKELIQLSLSPSPVKVIYERDELETAALSLCECLLAVSDADDNEETLKDSASVTEVTKPPKVPKRPKRRKAQRSRLPSPPLVVQQLMEMGFSRRVIEKALNQLGDETIRPEMVVQWLLDHPDIESVIGSAEKDSLSDVEELDDTVDSEDDPIYDDTSDSDIDSSAFIDERRRPLKQRGDFVTEKEYSDYIKDTVRLGMIVQFQRSLNGSVYTDVGKVTKVQTESTDSNGIFIEIEGTKHNQCVRVTPDSIESLKETGTSIRVGDKVRVKQSVTTPRYKWGSVNHKSIGTVVSISCVDDTECKVDFPQQSAWTGLVSELEVIPALHTGITCDVCLASPVIGSRFKCTVCSNFNLCDGCFNTVGDHKHTFVKYDEPNSVPLKCGRPRNYWNEAGTATDGKLFISEWNKCIKDIWITSKEDVARILSEGKASYKPTTRPKAKVSICLEMHPGLLIQRMILCLDRACRECSPSSAHVSAGTSRTSMRDLNSVTILGNETICLLENVREDFKFIEIDISLCRACLSACKEGRLHLICLQKPPIEGLPITFKFVAEDNREELDRKLQRSVYQGRSMEAYRSSDSRQTRVFVWGLNDKEQLGGLKGSKVKTPILSESLSSLHCQQIIGGSKTLFAVTYDGKLYACGESTNGRLGLGPLTGTVSVPRQVTAFSSINIKKVSVHSGGRHAMALTTEGKLYSWGEGEEGQLGHNNVLTYDTPKLIESFENQIVVEISCGSAHSAAVTDEGELYTWGLGEYGRLGHGDTERQLKPRLVKGLVGRRVIEVSCGSRDAQTICLTRDGCVWSWGDGDFGKLGRGGSEGCSVPHVVEKLTGLGICKVLCGAQFSLALSSSGRIYTWGKGDYYRLGHGSDSHVRRPQLVESLIDKKIIDVAVGALHCLAVTEDGEVFSWGDNDHGQQGNGTTIVNRTPARVLGLEGHRITRVACGSSHSIAWAEFNASQPLLVDPVDFSRLRDILGASYVRNEFERKKTKEHVGQHIKRQRPSLSKEVLQLKTDNEKQKALLVILESLQVSYVRDGVITVLSHLFSIPIKDGEHGNEWRSKQTQAWGDSTQPERTDSSSEENTLFRLEIAEVKCLVDLLKLGLSGRLDEEQIECLTSIIVQVARRNKEIAISVLDICTNELEELVSNHELIKQEFQPTVEETPHPYNGDCKLSGRVRVPGAERLNIEFDKNCSTERGHDVLTLKDWNGRTVAVRSGQEPSDWSNSLRIAGDEIRWLFNAQSKGAFWGWKFTAYPVLTNNGLDTKLFSDKTALALPSLGLARSLLDKGLHSIAGPGSHCTKLTFALAACTQISTLVAEQRCWVLKKLKKLLVSEVGPPLDVPVILCCGNYRDDAPSKLKLKSTGDRRTKELISSSALGELIRGLPDILKKQFDFEEPFVRGGQQLLHSSFLRLLMQNDHRFNMFVNDADGIITCQVIVTAETRILKSFETGCVQDLPTALDWKALANLGRELGLDYLPCCSDRYRWAWFTKYCMAMRVAESLINRFPFPKDFVAEVRLRIQELCVGEESISYGHENQAVFTQEVDTQLLTWLARRPRDWSLSWGGSGNIYGWGHNHRGQLGGVEGSKVKIPQICENLAGMKPVQITGGEQTLFCVTAEGKIYATGYGSGGRLGIGGAESLNSPRLLESLQHVIIKKIAVHSGGKHCLALSSDGEVFSWGEGDDGKLGHGNKIRNSRYVSLPRVLYAIFELSPCKAIPIQPDLLNHMLPSLKLAIRVRRTGASCSTIVSSVDDPASHFSVQTYVKSKDLRRL